jgi:ribonuclease M5
LIKIKKPIIVEGKYDKIKLSSFIDALIIQTDGFGIFKEKDKVDMLRTLAEKTGILVLTDSDTAGFKIRNYLNSCIPNKYITHVYIPDVFGKEKRKVAPSKEGKLGVEGVEKEIIIKALERAGVIGESVSENVKKITKTDFFIDGLSGNQNSQLMRQKLIKLLDLPEHLSANALIGVLNAMMSYDEYKEKIEIIKE